MSERIPILLDTDPGSDIDDALAIAYLARHPRCEFVGITTVSGEVAKRAAIAEIVCRQAGRTDIPIHAGTREVLAQGCGQPRCPHYDAVSELPHKGYPENQAVDYLRRTIRERPGEIILLTIGPFTNIALLFAIDPEIPSLLRGLVSMAGRFFDHDPYEWNCIVDPAATAAVLKRTHAHDLVGLDVTVKCQLPTPETLSRFGGDAHAPIRAMASKWGEHTSQVTFHDPLAAALIFDPSLCTWRRGRATSPTHVDGKPTDGPTLWEDDPHGPHRAAETVDSERFFANYFEIVNGA